MAIEFMCRKVGMTQLFDDEGACLPTTVLEATPNVVIQKKSDANDGYTALQLGWGTRRESLFTKPELGHFKKAGASPNRVLSESRITATEAEGFEVGQENANDRLGARLKFRFGTVKIHFISPS